MDSTVLKLIGGIARALEMCAPDESTGRDHRDARDSRDERAGWSDFFDEYEDRHRRHPYEVHHAHDEEDAHQRPAAAQAVRAVLDPHAHGPARSIPPVGHEESERASAVRQTRALERSELIDTGSNQNGAAEPCGPRRHRR